jgi:hypothetical protein
MKRASLWSRNRQPFSLALGLDSLLEALAPLTGMGGPPLPLGEWAAGLPVILDGRPFSFRKHEYLEAVYADPHPYQVFLKAAQLGLTTLAILRALYGCRYRAFHGVLYLFPSRGDALDFSRGRVSPLISDNPESIGRWITETDSAGLKKVGQAHIYLRGMHSRTGLKSVPVDLTVFDEVDEAPQNAVDMAMERMAHSEVKEVILLSNPTLPDYGIARQFELTDQRYWLLHCDSCGEWTCLEDTFPGCLVELDGGKVIRACGSCGGELDPSRGQWVAKKPSVTDRRGYHFSQLFSHFVEPREILHQYRTTQNPTDFHNLKLGVPWVDASNRLSVEEILALCGSEGISSEDPGPCSMGVDQGKDLHVVIGKRHSMKAGRIVHIGVYRDWEELDVLMRRFHVARCVVDGLPETRNARALAERHRGRVFLSFYAEFQKGNYRWNEADLTVSANRTESLDASHNQILTGSIVLPGWSDMVRTFAAHCHNVAKKLEEDEESGSKRYTYVRLGPDHFRHALNYETMARQYLSSSFFAGCDLS